MSARAAWVHQTPLAFRAVSPAKPATPSSGHPATLRPVPAAYVHPGQVMVSSQPGVLSTILGSCVAVCLHDAQAALGGINHYLLPTMGAEVDQLGRYGPTAIEQLLKAVLERGAARERLVAHIVGGASVLAAFSEPQHLGLRNAAVAREVLAAHRIRVIGTDVGGTHGRKLIFSPRDGRVDVTLIGA